MSRGYHALCRACASVERVRHSVGGYLRAAIYNGMVRDDSKLVSWLPKGRRVEQLGDIECNPLAIFWSREDCDETLDLIRWVCQGPIDRQIVNSRVEGLSIPAVGHRLGLTSQEVRKVLLRIEVDLYNIRRSR